VSSIRILETFYSGRKAFLYVLYHIHLAAFNSVELFFEVVITANIESESVGSIMNLEGL
jgi:hypothetical protein